MKEEKLCYLYHVLVSSNIFWFCRYLRLKKCYFEFFLISHQNKFLIKVKFLLHKIFLENFDILIIFGTHCIFLYKNGNTVISSTSGCARTLVALCICAFLHSFAPCGRKQHCTMHRLNLDLIYYRPRCRRRCHHAHILAMQDFGIPSTPCAIIILPLQLYNLKFFL